MPGSKGARYPYYSYCKYYVWMPTLYRLVSLILYPTYLRSFDQLHRLNSCVQMVPNTVNDAVVLT